ncbi:MAG: choice-of-anchor D domain-containing protein, partial [Planctomycetes bacterium]|nr:choice-of-anchor D domain-containing protein [Planctomycetota bacterium]
TTTGGSAALTISPFSVGPNLDILARLYDATGTLLDTSDSQTELTASFSRTLSAGVYYISVEGTGVGDPLSNPPTGYTDYGSLGQYWVTGTIQSDTTGPRVTAMIPSPGASGAGISQIVPFFDEDLAAATMNTSTFRVSSAIGADNEWGTSDDTYVAGSVAYDANTDNAAFVPTVPFGNGQYGVILLDLITDLSGNALDGEYPGSEPGLPSGDGAVGGKFVTTITVTGENPGEVVVEGLSSENIADGDSTPSATDGTDFGAALKDGSALTRTFTVRNSGTGTLNLGAPTVPTGYTVTEPLNTEIGAGGSDTFTVQLSTANTGTFAGDISFATNDSDENPFNFRVTGTISPLPTSAALGVNRSQWLSDLSTQHEFRASLEGAGLSGAEVGKPSGEVVPLVEISPDVFAYGFYGTEGEVTTAFPDGLYEMRAQYDNGLTWTGTGTLSGAFPPYPQGTSPVHGSSVSTLQPTISWNQWLQTPDATHSIWVEIEDAATQSVVYSGRTSPLPADSTSFQVPAGVLVDGGTYEIELAFSSTSSGGQGNWPVVGKGAEDIWQIDVHATPAPEIVVEGLNSQNIVDGDTTPNVTDGTDLGAVAQDSLSPTSTFTVRNTGTSALTLGTPSVPSGFTITDPLSTSIAAGGSDTFTLQLSTSAVGTFSGDVSFTTNDSNESPFNFRITGIVTADTPTAGGWAQIGQRSAKVGGVSNNDSRSLAPSLAAETDGDLVMAWADNGDNSDFDIYVRRWDGTAWQEMGAGSASGGGISQNSGSSSSPVVALGLDGNPIVAWADLSDGDWEIYVRRWTGTSWGEMGAGSATGGGISNNAGHSFAPSIQIGSDGRPVVAWSDGTDGDYEIYVRKWNQVTSLWEELGANSATGSGISSNQGDSSNPTVTLDSNGRPIVAWSDLSGGDAEIYVKRWDGTSWVEMGSNSATGGGISNNTLGSFGPSLALGTDERPVVVWYDMSDGSDSEIFVRKWDGASWLELGAGSGSGGGISNNSSTSEWPELVVRPSGLPVVAWTDADGTDSEIYVRHWNGSAWAEMTTGS